MNRRKFLCPEQKWGFDKKRFNGKIKMGTSIGISSGTDIEELLAGYENHYENDEIKKGKNDSPLKKMNIFQIIVLESQSITT